MDDLQSYQRRAPTIHLSALIDVLFIVFVFVVLVARFHDTPAPVRHLDVALPGTDSAPAPSAPDAAVLEVPVRGPMRLDGAPVADVEAIAPMLARARARTGTLVLAADGDIPLARAARLLDAATRAGFTDVSIATRAAGAASQGAAP